MSTTEPASFPTHIGAGLSDDDAQTQTSAAEKTAATELENPGDSRPDSATDKGKDNPSDGPSSSTRRYAGRIGGLDIARGLAILGMFYAHIAPIGDGSDKWSKHHTILSDIPNGRSAILFALLAGISLSILTGRNVPYRGERMATARKRIVGRALILVFFSMLTSLLNVAVIIILSYYAVWFLLALPFTSWNSRKLWTAAAFTAVFGPPLALLISWLASSLGLAVAENDPFLWTTLIAGNYPGMTYMAFIFAGMAIGRSQITQMGYQAKLLGLGVALMIAGYGASYALSQTFIDPKQEPASYGSVADEYGGTRAPSSTQKEDTETDKPPLNPNGEQPKHAFDFKPVALPTASQLVSAKPHDNTSFEAVGSGGFAIALTGLCLLIGRLSRNVLWPLAAVGSMSLTAYSVHLVVVGVKPDLVQNSWWGTLWISVGAVIGCSLWRLVFKRGPMEWMTWRFSYRFATLLSAEKISPPGESDGPLESGGPIASSKSV